MSDAELLSKIYETTRGDLENVRFPLPNLQQVMRGMSFVRLKKLARFWKAEQESSVVPLMRCMSDLVTGLYGLACPWIFLISGGERKIECWFGTSQRILEATSLGSLLRGSFPDARLDGTLSHPVINFNSLSQAMILTGTPSTNGTRENADEDQIEKICRGLYGTRWLYAVYAKPVPAVETVSQINDISEKIRSVRTSYLLKTSAIDEQNRVAQRYVELLEAKMKRFEQGRTMGMWNVRAMLLTDSEASSSRARALLYSAFSGEDSLPDPVRVRPCEAGSHQSSELEPLTSAELALLARPPMEAYPGLEIVENARFGVEGYDNGSTAQSPGVIIGDILDRGMKTGNQFTIPLRDLTMHGLIAGVTGSGKTNTCFALLDQLWREGKGIPFLVIESAKSEYRNLLKNPRFSDLKVFTVGDETVSPLRLNPFEVPKGLLLQTHIDYLKSLFQAAFVLYPPMPYVLEQSLQEIYEDRGWDMVSNRNRRGDTSHRRFPTLLDLENKIGSVVDRMGYDERITMDVKAGLLARIKQLRLGGGKGLMLNTRRSTDLSVLYKSPCVLELKQVVNDDEKAFIIGLLLIRIYEYCESEAGQRTDGNLHHVTLIEEAHRLLRNVSTEQGSEVTANPKGRAIEVFANILSEIRAYGEGILIAEQVPTKLAPDAVKNTNLKIVHRLMAEDDRKVIGSTMNLSDAQSRALATLVPGQAVAFAQGMEKPALMKVGLSVSKARQSTVSSQEIKQTMNSFWRGNPHLPGPFQSCVKCPEAARGNPCEAGASHELDVHLRAAFKRFFNSLRLGHKFIRKTYTDFDMAHRHQRVRGTVPASSHCLLAGLIETEIERRGEFEGWSHNDVDRAIEQACGTLATITKLACEPASNELKQALRQSLTELNETFSQLYVRDALPYTGCNVCARPCYYHYDTASTSHSIYVKDFRAAFYDLEIGMGELARRSCDAVFDLFAPEDKETNKGAALCFAVQQLHTMGLARSDQNVTAEQLALAINALPD